MPQYLDQNGNPIPASAQTTYLDPNTGEPLSTPPRASNEFIDTLSGTAPWQKAIDNAATSAPYQGNAGDVGRAITNLGTGAAALFEEPLAHPIKFVEGLAKGLMPQMPTPDQGTMSPTGYTPPPATPTPWRQTGANLTAMIPGAALLAGSGTSPTAALDDVGNAILAPSRTIANAALLGKSPEGAYLSALKPSTTMGVDARSAIAQTGLREGIPVSEAGADKISALVQKLDDAKWGEINKNPNAPIDPNKVAEYTDRSRNFFSNQVNASQDVNAVDAARQQWLSERGALPGRPAIPPQPTGILDSRGNPIMTEGTPAQPPKAAPPMTASDAQAMKQNTGTILRKKFGQMGAAETEAQKDLVYGLKQELAEQFPAIKGINAREASLLQLEPAIDRAVARISNHQRIGIGTAIAGTAARTLTGSAAMGVAASIMKGVLDDPMVKSQLAITLSRAEKIPPFLAQERVANYASSLGAFSSAQMNGGNSYQSATAGQ